VISPVRGSPAGGEGVWSVQWVRRGEGIGPPRPLARSDWTRIAFFVAALAVAGLPAAGQEAVSPVSPVDMLGDALAAVDCDRTDLGYRPKGYWVRFPLPDRIPHVLPYFTDLFAEPLQIYDFGRTFVASAERYLDPAYRAENDNALHQLIYYMAVSRRLTTFRAYSADLSPPDTTGTPMLDAAASLYRQGGWPLETVTFGEITPWPKSYEGLAESLSVVPMPLQLVMAGLLEGLADAHRWWALAVRNVPADLRLKVASIHDFESNLGDGGIYHPEVDDVAAALDEPSLAFASMKAAAAVERARAEWRALADSGVASSKELRDLRVSFATPFGRVVLAGTANDAHAGGNLFCLVDVGGDDRYDGDVAAASPSTPISIVLDLAGNDEYVCETDSPAQGGAILGAGVLWDAGGDDRYDARRMSQGAARFGLGVLLDEDGDDAYGARLASQGAAYFGVGMLIDGGGGDRFDLEGDGQGFGGPGGVGALIDRDGDDRYYCEPYAEKAGRADYHSDFLVSVSNAQGVGSGRRADGSDGHSWAGGLGLLVDLAGDDHYEAGNWSQGVGYWFGTGLLYDAAGNDRYRSVYFTQASAAHFAIGALIDEGGDDEHELFENAGAGLGFGWDYAHALLFDRAGNDRYSAKIISIGLSDIRSNAFLVDLAGDDLYRLDRGQPGFGAADFREDYRVPDMRAPYNAHAESFGLMLDGGGEDRYEVRDPERDAVEPHPRAGNGRRWLTPEPGSEEWGSGNHGVGLDCDGGVIPEWERFGAGAATAR
jgi:hypothetical protein